MLEELLEGEATGEIAEIYGEIRHYSGVPYVSSLQRYMATLPGVLAWLWAALRPAMVSGTIPETGWRLAEGVRLRPAVPIAAAALPQMGVDGPGLSAIRNIADNFVRVAPVNLVMGGCIHLLLTGAQPRGSGFDERWSPPAPLPAMPGNADPDRLAPRDRANLMRLATEIDGKPFVPALYRQVAHWPGFLAWLADELASRFDEPQTAEARATFRAQAWAAAGDIVARLPGLPSRSAPSPNMVPRVLAAVDRYGGTSPEMTMFGRLILAALPDRL